MVSTVERCSWLRKIVPNLVPIFVHYYHHHHSCSAAAAVMLEMGTFSDSRIDGIFAGNWPRRPNLMDFRWGRSTTSFSKRFFCSSSASRDDDDSRAHIVIPFGISSNQSWIIRNYDDGLFKHQMMITEQSLQPLQARDDLSHPSITPMIIMIMVCCLHYFSIQQAAAAAGVVVTTPKPKVWRGLLFFWFFHSRANEFFVLKLEKCSFKISNAMRAFYIIKNFQCLKWPSLWLYC